jgi:hypothetical protein
VGNQYNCNPNEILEGIGAKLGICMECFEYKPIFYEGWCEECTWKLDFTPEEIGLARTVQ